MCSYFVASIKIMSNLSGVFGIAPGACPRIWVMFWERPDAAMFFCAAGNRSFWFDSIVYRWPFLF